MLAQNSGKGRVSLSRQSPLPTCRNLDGRCLPFGCRYGVLCLVRRRRRRTSPFPFVSFPRVEGALVSPFGPRGLVYTLLVLLAVHMYISALDTIMQAEAYYLYLGHGQMGSKHTTSLRGVKPDAICRIKWASLFDATRHSGTVRIPIDLPSARRDGALFSYLGGAPFGSQPVGSLHAAGQQDRCPGSHSIQARSQSHVVASHEPWERGPEEAVPTPSHGPRRCLN